MSQYPDLLDNNSAPDSTQIVNNIEEESNFGIRAAQTSIVSTLSVIILILIVAVILLAMGHFCYRKHQHPQRGIHEEEEI